MAPADGTATTPSLPNDVLVEILQLLPAKSVIRFRAVCKSWCLLLSDPAFIRDHHRRAPRAILLNDGCIDNGDAISALPFPYTDQSTAAPLYCGIRSQQTFLQGCCDGLILFSCSCLRNPERDVKGKRYRYFVCNPATREFARLPANLGQVEFVGFYRHEPTAEYRVLCHNYHPSITHPFEIYEYLVVVPGQHTIRRIGPSNLWTDTDCSLVHEPVTHRGCLHWMLYHPQMGVVVFDTTSEKFRLMRGPLDGDTCKADMLARLVGVDGTLGVSLPSVNECLLKLWVLESYEEEAWAFKYNIDVRFLDQDPFFSVSLAHVSDEGDAVLMTFGRKRVGVYNLRRGEVVSAMEEHFYGHLHGTDHIYQESLVSLAPNGVIVYTSPSQRRPRHALSSSP